MTTSEQAKRGEFTAVKHEQFQKILDAHLATTKQIIAKHLSEAWIDPVYRYFDLNAGPGYYADGAKGSPIRFLDSAERLLAHGFEAWFFEEDHEALTALRATLAEHRAHRPSFFNEVCAAEDHVVSGDHNVTVPEVIAGMRRSSKKAYGLIFGDPNGTAIDTGPIRELLAAPGMASLDVLLYIAATPYKRIRGAGFSDRFLMDDINAVGKKHCWIREPMGAHQWTFAICTNWTDFPRFKRMGFHDIRSEAGAEVLRNLNLSSRERGEAA